MVATTTADSSRALAGMINNDMEEIRNLASCKICLRPFYEPFMLNCGHTFCYSCLRSWVCGGDSRRKQKSCPECRAGIREQPAPNYVLRDLAHMFTDRAELLPPDETLEEHARGKTEEAQLLATDRQGPGLFQNKFKRYFDWTRTSEAIWDHEDGVQRCPGCHWEMEDGYCDNCNLDLAQDSFDENGSGEDDNPDFYSDNSTEMPISSDGEGDEDEESGAPGLYDNYEPTDASEANTETDPFPWGYREQHQLDDNIVDLDEDDEDDEEDEEDELDEDDMDGFIDDSDHTVDGGYDSDGIISRAHNIHSSAFGSHGTGGRYRTVQPRLIRYGILDDESSDDEEDNEDEIQDYVDHDALPDDEITNYDESEEDEEPLAPHIRYPAPKRRGRIVLSDDDDDEEEEEEEEEEGEDEDEFEDALTSQTSRQSLGNRNHTSVSAPRLYDRSIPTLSSTRSTREEEDANEDLDDNDNNDEDEDEDDDDEPINAARIVRDRSRRIAMHNANVDSRPERNQRLGISRHSNSHGFHPYSRQRGRPSSTNNRYRGTTSGPRGNTRATYVY